MVDKVFCFWEYKICGVTEFIIHYRRSFLGSGNAFVLDGIKSEKEGYTVESSQLKQLKSC